MTCLRNCLLYDKNFFTYRTVFTFSQTRSLTSCCRSYCANIRMLCFVVFLCLLFAASITSSSLCSLIETSLYKLQLRSACCFINNNYPCNVFGIVSGCRNYLFVCCFAFGIIAFIYNVTLSFTFRLCLGNLYRIDMITRSRNSFRCNDALTTNGTMASALLTNSTACAGML